MTAAKILIIDDSSLSLELMRSVLENAGYTVITRDNPFGSSAAVLRDKPDLILVDVSMPGLSGQKMVSLMRKYPDLQRVKILLCSDRSEQELQSLTDTCGADGYITKSDLASIPAQVNSWFKSSLAKADKAAKSYT